MALKQNVLQHQAPHNLLLASDLNNLQQQLLIFRQIRTVLDANSAAAPKPSISDSSVTSSYAFDRKRADDEFLEVIEKHIITPLNAVQTMLFDGNGPRAFIDKCHNKRLDYARLNAENSNNNATGTANDSLARARNIYTALREHLLCDLTQLNERVQNIITCAMQILASAKRILLFRMLRAVELFSARANVTLAMESSNSAEMLLKKTDLLFIEKPQVQNSVDRTTENIASELLSFSSVSESTTKAIHSTKKPVQTSSPVPRSEIVVHKKMAPPRPPPIKLGHAALPNSLPAAQVLPAVSLSKGTNTTAAVAKETPALTNRIFSKLSAPKLPVPLVGSKAGGDGRASTKKLYPKRVVYPSYISESQKRSDVFVVCFNFITEHDVELSCEPGDVVVVLSRQDLTSNSEWWYVEKCVEMTKLGVVLDAQVQQKSIAEWGEEGGSGTGGRGYVPASYLQQLPFR